MNQHHDQHLEELDTSQLLSKSRSYQKQFSNFENKLLQSLSSVWDNFLILKEQHDMLMNCIDWIRKQKDDSLQLVHKAIGEGHENPDELFELHNQYKRAAENGIQHFAPSNEFDPNFLDKLITSFNTQSGEILRRWEDHRRKYFDNTRIHPLANEIDNCYNKLKLKCKQDINVLDTDEENEAKISQEKADLEFALQLNQVESDEPTRRRLRPRNRQSYHSSNQVSDSDDDDDFEEHPTRKRRSTSGKKEKISSKKSKNSPRKEQIFENRNKDEESVASCNAAQFALLAHSISSPVQSTIISTDRRLSHMSNSVDTRNSSSISDSDQSDQVKIEERQECVDISSDPE